MRRVGGVASPFPVGVRAARDGDALTKVGSLALPGHPASLKLEAEQ